MLTGRARQDVVLRDFTWIEQEGVVRIEYTLANLTAQTVRVEIEVIAERRMDGRTGAKISLAGYKRLEQTLSPSEQRVAQERFELASGVKGELRVFPFVARIEPTPSP